LDGVNPGGKIVSAACGKVMLDFGLGTEVDGRVNADAAIVGPKSKIKDKQSRVIAALSVLNEFRRFHCMELA